MSDVQRLPAEQMFKNEIIEMGEGKNIHMFHL